MTNLDSSIRKLPLNWVAIPGSHDSFSYAISKYFPSPAPDAPDWMHIPQYIPFLLLNLQSQSILASWARTQSIDFTKQLDIGIRYFDMRVAKYDDDNTFWLVHGFYALLMKDAVQQIAKWLPKHPNEVIIIDFNHHYAMNKHSDADRVADILKQTFGNRILHYEPSRKNMPSLQEINNKGKQVILIHQYGKYKYSHVESEFWPGHLFPSLWPDQNTITGMIDKTRQKFKTYRSFGDTHQFVILQAVMGVSAANVFKYPSGISGSSADATKALLQYMKKEGNSEGYQGVNLVIADYVHRYGYVDGVLALNDQSKVDRWNKLQRG